MIGMRCRGGKRMCGKVEFCGTARAPASLIESMRRHGAEGETVQLLRRGWVCRNGQSHAVELEDGRGDDLPPFSAFRSGFGNLATRAARLCRTETLVPFRAFRAGLDGITVMRGPIGIRCGTVHVDRFRQFGRRVAQTGDIDARGDPLCPSGVQPPQLPPRPHQADR